MPEKPTEKRKNQRKTVRYVRDDITAILIKKSLIKSSDEFVRLLDISTKGALIKCSVKLRRKKKVGLRLIFSDGRKFALDATVVHIVDPKEKQYGLEFSKLNNDLGDHLLLTQIDLILK